MTFGNMTETGQMVLERDLEINFTSELLLSTSPEITKLREESHLKILAMKESEKDQIDSERSYDEEYESSATYYDSDKLVLPKRQPSRGKMLNQGKSYQLSLSDIEDIAKKLYDEKFVLISPEEYTQFLAAHGPDSSAIRDHYMDLFKWDRSLIKSTRKLCAKLFLKGESQEIDRLLSAFTKSYLSQHPDNIFCTNDFEQIYIVMYSLILLNTSLHNSGVNKKSKLSQADYVRNTLTTFLSQNKTAASELTVKQKLQIERELNDYYEDLISQELHLKQNNNFHSFPRDVKNSKRLSIPEAIFYSTSGVRSDNTASSPVNESEEWSGFSRRQSGDYMMPSEAIKKRRTSYGINRVTSIASASSDISNVSDLSVTSIESSGYNSRVGFMRALLSDSHNRASVYSSLHNRQSMENLRRLSYRSSRSSINTKELSIIKTESCEDAFSKITFDDIPNLELLTSRDQELYKLEHFDACNFQDSLDLKLELQGAPYLKEGLLKLRIQNNDMADSSSPRESNISSTNSIHSVSSPRNFFSFFLRSANKESLTLSLGNSGYKIFGNKVADYFVVVSKGELRLYSFDPKVIKRQQEKAKKSNSNNFFCNYDHTEVEKDLGDGNWLKNAALIGNYNLCSTIAQLENVRSPSSAPPKAVFSLLFPQTSKKPPKRFLFEAGTLDVANEFVNTCNFWASLLTAVPTLEESVSSIEYGWTNLENLLRLRENFKKTKSISKWESIPRGIYLSNLSTIKEGLRHEGILKHFAQTIKYYNNLKNHYTSLNMQKSQFIKCFRSYWNSSNYKLVMQNYDQRSQEYKTELKKYQSYVAMLACGLKLRFNLQHDDEMKAWTKELSRLPSFQSPEALALELRKLKDAAEENESSLTKAVKLEIERLSSSSPVMTKLFARAERHEGDGAKGPGTGHSSSRTIPYITNNQKDIPNNASLVKSPKIFSLADLDNEKCSPVNQLLSVDQTVASGEEDGGRSRVKLELTMSHSTNTITEEEEPEE